MPQRTGRPIVRLRVDKLRSHAREHGALTDADTAVMLGMSGANLSRLLRGDIKPGEDAIAAALAAFPALKFEDLFSIEPGEAA